MLVFFLAVSARHKHEATPKQVPVAIHQNELKQEEVSGAKVRARHTHITPAIPLLHLSTSHSETAI